MFLNIFKKFKNNKKKNSVGNALNIPKNIIKDFNKTRPIEARDYFCNAPFRNMYFSPEGYVFVCCYNQKHILGNIKEKSIKEIWNSAEAEKIRQSIKNYEFVPGCDECKYALQSRQFESVQISSYDKYSGHPEFPTYMEFQISTTCNLECTMCTGDFSTSIASNRENRNNSASPYYESFISQIEEFVPYLKHAMFSGGEPFMSKIYFDIWELINRINPRCNIMVQTNGTILNEKVKSVINGGIYNIGISLDSLNEKVYNKIRVNASLNTTLKNILFFADFCHSKRQSISISVCPMQQNWNEIPDILRFCNKNEIGIYFCTVWFPGKNALWVLESKKIKEIITFLSTEQFESETPLQKINVSVYKNLIKTLDNWFNVAARWEKYQPKEVSRSVIEKTENEIIEKIQNYYSDNSLVNESEKKEEAFIIIGKLKKTFDLITNNDLKLKGLQMLLSYRGDKIIRNIYREDDEGLFLLINNFFRFRDL